MLTIVVNSSPPTLYFLYCVYFHPCSTLSFFDSHKKHKNLATTPLSHFSWHFQPYHFGCHEWLSASSSHAFQCPFFDSLFHTTWVINQNTTSPTFLCDLSLVVLVFWKPKAIWEVFGSSYSTLSENQRPRGVFVPSYSIWKSTVVRIIWLNL